jgi:hypothetical protein
MKRVVNQAWKNSQGIKLKQIYHFPNTDNAPAHLLNHKNSDIVKHIIKSSYDESARRDSQLWESYRQELNNYQISSIPFYNFSKLLKAFRCAEQDASNLIQAISQLNLSLFQQPIDMIIKFISELQFHQNANLVLNMIEPMLHNDSIDGSSACYLYFIYKKLRCGSPTFHQFLECIVIENRQKLNIRDYGQFLGGLNLQTEPLSFIQKKNLDMIYDHWLSTPDLQIPRGHLIVAHTIAKKSYGSDKLFSFLMNNFESVSRSFEDKRNYKDYGSYISNVVRIGKNSDFLKTQVYPSILRNLNFLGPKHKCNIAFHASLSEFYDRDFWAAFKPHLEAIVVEDHPSKEIIYKMLQSTQSKLSRFGDSLTINYSKSS